MPSAVRYVIVEVPASTLRDLICWQHDCRFRVMETVIATFARFQAADCNVMSPMCCVAWRTVAKALGKVWLLGMGDHS